SFAVTLKTAGIRTVTATDTAYPAITGSQTVTVNAGPATHYTVTGLITTTAGTAQLATVTARDTFENTATAYAGTVHLTSTDAAAVLGANSTLTSGVGSFAVTLKTAGIRTVTATDMAYPATTGSQTVTVNAGPATHYTVTGLMTATAGT